MNAFEREEKRGIEPTTPSLNVDFTKVLYIVKDQNCLNLIEQLELQAETVLSQG